MALFDDEIETTKTTNLLNGTDDTTGTPDDISDITKLDDDETVVVEDLGSKAATKPPGRYAGKTQEELAQMLEDAQAHIGRQSSEIGEVRKLADDLVKKSLTVSNVKEVTPPVQEEDEDDFFTNPEAAVARAVSKHPAVTAAKEAADLAARERSTAQVLKSHPDMTQVIGSPEFAAWVKASPMRVRMYALADQFDVEAADELLTNFKASSGNKAVAAPVTQPTAAATKAIAATLAAGSVGTTETAASTPAAKKYRRSDIMRLMTSDPARYEAMADEILKAYADGRVV